MGRLRVGHRLLSRDGLRTAAVLAAGSGAVLSHRSAAALWGIRDTSRGAIEVTAPHKCRLPGIDAYRAVLAPDEIDIHHGIPVTNPARTLLDLAQVVTQQQLEHALNEAEIRRLTSPLPLDALIARHARREGTTAIRRALEKHRQTSSSSTATTSTPRAAPSSPTVTAIASSKSPATASCASPGASSPTSRKPSPARSGRC